MVVLVAGGEGEAHTVVCLRWCSGVLATHTHTVGPSRTHVYTVRAFLVLRVHRTRHESGETWKRRKDEEAVTWRKRWTACGWVGGLIWRGRRMGRKMR